MRLWCPAKINLHLRVGRRRESDGFHPLLTWMTTVGLFDRLTVEALPHQGGAAENASRGEPSCATRAAASDAARDGQPPPGLERAGAAAATAAGILLLRSDLPGMPNGADNLVVRAAEALAAAIAGVHDCVGEGANVVGPGAAERTRDGGEAARAAIGGITTGSVTGAGVMAVAAMLEKNIPLGAGLGGGSSDAARTLQGLNAMWRANLPAERLAELAACLGSDVPFFLLAPSAVCAGRGEVVSPVPPPGVAKWAVLVLPGVHMPTADVYRRFDEMDLGFDDMIDRPPAWHEWAERPSEQLLPALVNDLEHPAFDIRPDLGTLRRDIELVISRPVRLSGSGSSLFTLFDAEAAASHAAAEVTARFGVRALAAEVAPAVRDDLNTNFAQS